MTRWKLPPVFSDGWKEFVWMLAVMAVCLGVLAFLEISDEVREGDFHAREQGWIRQLRTTQDPSVPIGPKWLIQGSLDVTALGSPIVLTLLTIAVLIALLLEGKRRQAFLVFMAIVGGTLLSRCLKIFFDRERPTVVPHLAEVGAYSYPSGHSMLSAVVYLTLAILVARSVELRSRKVYLICAALGLSVIIGISRVYLGVHYPTDVLAGWAAGSSWAVFCWLVADYFERKTSVKIHQDE